jgi:hypothetical protein
MNSETGKRRHYDAGEPGPTDEFRRRRRRLKPEATRGGSNSVHRIAPRGRAVDHEEANHEVRPNRTIPGDGIGEEVVPAGRSVIEGLATTSLHLRFEFESFDRGGDLFRTHGTMVPARGLDVLRGNDAILFGLASDPHIPDHVTLRDLRLAICQGLDQDANVRPTRILSGIDAPLMLASQISKESLGLSWDKEPVDAVAARVVNRPASLDTLVATDLHADRQYRPRAPLPIDVRADGRLGLRHHRPGPGQSSRHLLVGGDAARAPRRNRCCAATDADDRAVTANPALHTLVLGGNATSAQVTRAARDALGIEGGWQTIATR